MEGTNSSELRNGDNKFNSNWNDEIKLSKLHWSNEKEGSATIHFKDLIVNWISIE